MSARAAKAPRARRAHRLVELPAMRGRSRAPAKSPIQARRGWIVTDDSTVTGGTTYERIPILNKVHNDGTLETRFETRKIVDNDSAVYAVNQCIKHMAYACRKYCVRMENGWWFADAQALEAVRQAQSECEDEVQEANLYAMARGSACRATIDIVALEINPDSEDVIRKVRLTLQKALGELHGLLSSGEIGNSLTIALLKHRNLQRLVEGSQSEEVAQALKCVVEARSEIRKLYAAGWSAHEAGAAVDLKALEMARGRFN